MTRDEMRAAALRIFKAGVAAADPYAAVDAALRRTEPAPGVTIIAVGKAAIRMAEAARAHVADPAEILIVTNPENASDVEGARVFAAAHPVPDGVGVEAALAVEAALGRASSVLALISGGGSALLPAPADGLTLADKIAVSELLLASGAEITEMNLVRQQLSRLKGGGMLRAASGPVRALILSDVVGDDLRAIASGPTVAPLGSRGDARALLERYGLW
ncbi:MAG: glycerate-2-kinase family protein, partial [Pseudomonadota bacterium]